MSQGDYRELAARKAASTGKRYMVTYNDRKRKFSVRLYGSYSVHEELVSIH